VQNILESRREIKSNRAAKANELRGRFISALRRYNLNGAEFRVIIALNDLYNPEYGMAWSGEKYLAETTGLSLRSVERAIGRLRAKGLFYTSARPLNLGSSIPFTTTGLSRQTRDTTIRNARNWLPKGPKLPDKNCSLPDKNGRATRQVW